MTGASFQDIINYTKHFYAQPYHPSSPRFDRNFISQLWARLACQDELFIGSGNQYKTASLDQVEAQFPGLLTEAPDLLAPITTSKHGSPPGLAKSQDADVGPRITASQRLIYHAVCGHDPDDTKVTDIEFALLRAICAARHDGIMQGELRQITGQDARSVPRRTDTLQQKGYIVKRAVYQHGHKTSLLFLRRFSCTQDGADAGNSSLSLKDLAQRIFAVLKASPLISQDELASQLSILDLARRQVLDQVVQLLEQRELLRKVKTSSAADSSATDLKITLQNGCETINVELEKRHGDLIDLSTSLDAAVAQLRRDDVILEASGTVPKENDHILVDTPSKTSNCPSGRVNSELLTTVHDLAARSNEHNAANNITQRKTNEPSTGQAESLNVWLSQPAVQSQSSGVRDQALLRTNDVEDGVSGSGEADGLLGIGQRAQPSQLQNHRDSTIKKSAHLHDSTEGPGEANSELDRNEGAALSPASDGSVRPSSQQWTPPPKLSSPRSTTRPKEKSKAQSLRSAPTKKGSAAIIKKIGRPRKFMRGTEKFWQLLFHAKKIESDPGNLSKGKKGIMNDPTCMEMFANRPRDFDETLVKALAQDLPVPLTPAGINESWVGKMTEFLNRTGVGAFFVPSGMTHLQQWNMSCPVVVRSTRLNEIKPATKQPCSKSVLFLSSSAAHTFRRYHIGRLQRSNSVKELNEAAMLSSTDTHRSAFKIHEAAETVEGLHISRVESSIADGDSSSCAIAIQPHTTSSPVGAHTHPTSHNLPDNSVSENHLADFHHTGVSRPLRRTQRNRRPTQKALESTFAPTLDDLERSCSPVATSSSAQWQQDPVPAPKILHSQRIVEPDSGRGRLTRNVPDHVTGSDLVNGNVRVILSNHPDQVDRCRPGSQNQFHSLEHHPNSPPSREIGSDAQRQVEETNSNEGIAREFEHAQTPPQHAGPSDPSFQDNIDPSSHVDPSLSLSINDVLNPLGEKTASQSITANDSVALCETNTHTTSKQVTDMKEINLQTAGAVHLILPKQTENIQSEPEGSQIGKDPPSSATGSHPPRLLSGRDATPYYRKFIMELVHMCGGVVPHDPPMLKRAMGAKCIEACVEPSMNVKLIKSSIRILTQCGKLKVMQFAFQRNGFNHTKAILGLPEIQPSDQIFTAMQSRIMSLPPNLDYIPPELAQEEDRQPQSVLRIGDSPDPKVGNDSESVALAKSSRPKRQSEIRTRRGSAALSQRLTSSPSPLPTSPHIAFLTLKVPNIGRIRTNVDFTSKYYSLPAQPIILNSDTRVESPGAGRSLLRRSSNRNPRQSASDAASRKVQWIVPKRTPLPKSLRAILANNDRAKQVDYSLSVNPALEIFDRDVNFVASWEESNIDDLQDPKPGEWNFINHLSSRRELFSVKTENELQFRLVDFNQLHEEVETELPEPESWDVFAEIVAKEASKLQRVAESGIRRKRKAQDEFIDAPSDIADDSSDFLSSGNEEHPKKRRKRSNHKWRRKPRIAGTENDKRRQRRSGVNPRGIGLRDIPKALAHRITTAIVVVKVLVGGLEKYLDWKLVRRLIPGEPESMLQSRWRTLSTRYNNDFDAMVQDFQTKYLEALADDKVPSVNYDNLDGTNWEAIFEWAVANISADGKGTGITEIPPNRDEFLELYTVEVSEPAAVRYLHNSSLQYTQSTKEDVLCAVVFGTTAKSVPVAAPKQIQPAFPAENEEADIVLARARSWVLAAVITPHRSFDPHVAHEKLRRLAGSKQECEKLIDRTLKKLQSDKVVVTKDSADAVIEWDGSTLSGTYDWKLSTKFLDRFEMNRFINSTMLKEAVRYKVEVLDPAFASGEVVVIPGNPILEDGKMVAIFNLMNMEMLKLELPKDMPSTRYGIDGENEGYKTRSMDKKNLFFSINLKPTSRYAHGDLSLSARKSIPIPRGDMDQQDGFGLIPVWFDINHDFQAEIWEMIAGAVTGLISCRPGVSTIELVRTFGNIVSYKDLKMMVHYLSECELIKETSSGWEATEKWWFAVGSGIGHGVSTEQSSH